MFSVLTLLVGLQLTEMIEGKSLLYRKAQKITCASSSLFYGPVLAFYEFKIM